MKPILRTATACLAAAGLAAAGMLAVATSAQADTPTTSSIDFTTIATGPTSGTLANGVNWTVDNGTWNTTQGYVIYPGGEPTQTWTFDQPVTVDFSVAGLNCGGEAMQLPADVQPVSINANHAYNPSTHIVTGHAAGAADASEFAIGDAVSSFSVSAVGAGGCGRGITALSVTFAPPVETINGPAEGATYFQGQVVPADYTCTDASSTVTSCNGDVANGSPVDTATTGDKSFSVTGTNARGQSSTASVAYKVVAVAGECRGTPLSLLSLHPGEQNSPTSPCASGANRVALQNLVLTPAIPLLHIPGNNLSLSVIEGSTQTSPYVPAGVAAAQSHVANATLNLLGISLKVTGLRSETDSTLVSCDKPAITGGQSYIADLILNGKRYVVGSQAVTIPLGIGALYLNQHVVAGNTVTQRALFLDLPGTALDISLGESVSGASCA